jgi:Putative prokaryotic signal transducing protein
MELPLRFKRLMTVRTEVEGAIIVGLLAENGIEAQAVGGHLAGFRAEVPAMVQVLVAETQVELAQEIVNEAKRASAALEAHSDDEDFDDDEAN